MLAFRRRSNCERCIAWSRIPSPQPRALSASSMSRVRIICIQTSSLCRLRSRSQQLERSRNGRLNQVLDQAASCRTHPPEAFVSVEHQCIARPAVGTVLLAPLDPFVSYPREARRVWSVSSLARISGSPLSSTSGPSCSGDIRPVETAPLADQKTLDVDRFTRLAPALQRDLTDEAELPALRSLMPSPPDSSSR